MKNIEKHYRWLHQHPELSFCEHQTQEYILSVLEGLGVECHRVADTGVMAVIGNSSMPTVVLRADMDALPITETTGLSYSSQNQGVMHACGHDMHIAMLLGVVQNLARQNPPADRAVVALFQPAEELVPGGAIKVIDSGVLNKFDVRAVVAQHVSPELEVGAVGVCKGEFMASCDEIRFTVNGRGGHAALPQNILDPVRAAVELLHKLYEISDRYKDQKIILSFGTIDAQGATNVIPNRVQIEGTLRTFSEELRNSIKTEIQEVATTIDKRFAVNTEVNIADGYPPVYNHPELVENIEKTLHSTQFSGTLQQILQRMTAEDFGRYGTLYPSCMLRLGVGSNSGCALHNAGFYPNPEALNFGVETLTKIAQSLQL